ncbi:hypothetical protein AA0229_1838 [Gluconobacter cerinus NRIC 0229]|nr:hypothetical protein AA0229_1838 [Gluconobacter cerinus NRIC 0229]
MLVLKHNANASSHVCLRADRLAPARMLHRKSRRFWFLPHVPDGARRAIKEVPQYLAPASRE